MGGGGQPAREYMKQGQSADQGEQGETARGEGDVGHTGSSLDKKGKGEGGHEDEAQEQERRKRRRARSGKKRRQADTI